MLKKEITFETFDGEKVTKPFYFNLTQAEAIEMDSEAAGGLEKYAKVISENKSPARVVQLLKDLILRSYGEKSDDGLRFIKTPEIAASFASTDAYSVLFTELLTNTQSLIDFFVGISPSGAKAKIKESGDELVKKIEAGADAGDNNTQS